MKRRPLLLAVVLTVAAVACIAPFWWEIWLMVAYEEKSKHPLMYDKRFYWIPGAPLLLMDSTCGRCIRTVLGDEGDQSAHIKCDLLWYFRDGAIFQMVLLGSDRHREAFIESVAEFPHAVCTCPTCHPERGE